MFNKVYTIVVSSSLLHRSFKSTRIFCDVDGRVRKKGNMPDYDTIGDSKIYVKRTRWSRLDYHLLQTHWRHFTIPRSAFGS